MSGPMNSYLQVRLTARQREALEYWARQSEIPLSELVREFLSVPHPDTFNQPPEVIRDDEGVPVGQTRPWDYEDVVEKLQELAAARASGSTYPGGER